MEDDRLKGADAQNIRVQQVQSSIDQWANQQSEERRRWAIERALQLIHALGGKHEDAERLANRFNRFAEHGSFDGADQ